MEEPSGLDQAVCEAEKRGLKISREDIRALLRASLRSELTEAIIYIGGRNSPISRHKTPGRLHKLVWEGQRMARDDMSLPGIVGVCTEGDGRLLQEGGRYSTTDLVRLAAMHSGLPDPWPRGG